MLPLLYISLSVIAGIYSFGFLSQEEDATAHQQATPAPIVLVSPKGLALKENEAWDASYLLGCHAKAETEELLFCYETISGKTILGYYEAFRHGNSLLEKYSNSQDPRFLFASGYVTQAGMRNFRSIQEQCLGEEADCPDDLTKKISRDISVASALGQRYAGAVKNVSLISQ